MNTTEGIIKSEIFMALVTDSYINNAKCLAELRVAIDHNKVIVLAVEGNTKLDESFLEGAKHVEIIEWQESDPNAMEKVAKRIKKFGENLIVEIGGE